MKNEDKMMPDAIWVAEFVSTVTNVTQDKVDMYRLNGDGITLCTMGVPHGDKEMAHMVCEAVNKRNKADAQQDVSEALECLDYVEALMGANFSKASMIVVRQYIKTIRKALEAKV